jgi:hypothetical protein
MYEALNSIPRNKERKEGERKERRKMSSNFVSLSHFLNILP